MFTLNYNAGRLPGAPVMLIGVLIAAFGFALSGGAHGGEDGGFDLAMAAIGWLGVSGGMFVALMGLAMFVRPTRVVVDETGIHVFSPFYKTHYLWDDISGFEKAGWADLRILLTPTAAKLLGGDPKMPRPPHQIELDLFNRLRAAKGAPNIIAF